MRIAIIIPPWLHPTSPPLGAASISSFLKRENPKAQIQLFDLNLKYYYKALEYMDRRRFGIRLYNWDQETTASRVKESFCFLKKNRLSQVSKGKWHEMATIFLSFENIFNGFMAEMTSRSLLDMDIPGPVDEFFTELTQEVADYLPEMSAVSVFFDAQMVFALEISRRIKEKTDSFICFGGARFGTCPQPQRLFEKPLKIKAKGQTGKVNHFRFIDALIPGEGEIPLLELSKGLQSAALREVPGLIYRTSSALEINPPPPLLHMNRLPVPDFSDLPLEKYMAPAPVLPLMTSRGCAWGKCTFCTHHKIYKRYRQMDVKKVAFHLKELEKRHHTAFFNLFDEMLPPARARNLSKVIIEEGLNISFSAYAKPFKPFGPALLERLRNAGCRLMLWGVESGSQRVLNLMQKGTNVAEMADVLRYSSEAGIRNLIFVMFGFPGETASDFELTIKFLEKTSPFIDALSKGLFVLVEGCEVQKRPEKFCITNMQPSSDNWSGATSYSFKTSCGLSQEEAFRLYKKHLPFLETLGISPRLGVYRDHLLF